MRLILLGLLALTLAACSKLSLGVRWADTFVMSTVDDYFLLSSDQAKQAKSEFRQILLEVRRSEFPRLADLLDQFATKVEANEVDASLIDRWMNEAQAVIQAGVARFEPLGQRLVADESANGFERFDKEFERAFKKRSDQLASEKGRKKLAEKNMSRILAETVKTLRPEQKAWLEEFLAESPPPAILQHESRRHLYEKFREARGEEDSRKRYLREYFNSWNELQTAEYQEARDTYQNRLRGLFLKVLETASPEQKQNLVKNFRGRAKELRDLSI